MQTVPHKSSRTLHCWLVAGLAIASSGQAAMAQSVQIAAAKPMHAPAVIPREISWFTEVEPAWKIAQREGRPLLVYVTHDECVYCRKMEKQTYVHPTVTAAVSSAFVPLSLNGAAKSPLIKDLAVRSYPTTFVISPQAVILDRIDGYVSPDQLARRLAVLTPQKSNRPQVQPVAERKYSSTARAW